MSTVRCPRCKSREIRPHIGYYSRDYVCQKCGYRGSFVLETSSSAPDSLWKSVQSTEFRGDDDIPRDRMTVGSIALLIIVILIAILWILRSGNFF